MKKGLFVGALMAAIISSSAYAAKDPVVMTINNQDVKLSEFEYLYNKNNLQQQKKQSINEYKDVFVLYKLKVADAAAAGVDTTQTFIREFTGYRNDLAQPYLEDKSAEDRLAHEAYDRMKEDVEVSHIMVYPEDPKTKSIDRQKQLIDSLRQCVLKGEDFNELALKYSIDPSVKRNKGNLGYIVAGRYPYSFEYAAYATPIGSVSEPVQTDYGFHILKVHARRPSKGEVNVEHILKLFPRNATAEQMEAKKAEIDSIYTLVMNGENFEDLAKRESEDPGSARKGGALDWFGAGQMVPEFEKVAFETENGKISEPFRTAYGYHIIKKLDSRGIDSFENLRNKIVSQFAQDERAIISRNEFVENLQKTYKFAIDKKTLDYLAAAIEKNNGVDSTLIAQYSNCTKPIFTFAKQKVPASVVIEEMKKYGELSAKAGKSVLGSVAEEMGKKAVLDYEKDQLENKYPEFRNLVKEYHDGMMLYEISNQKVWDFAAKDKIGLAEYFNNHKGEYVWNAPKYKGYVIQITNDSVAQLVNNRLNEIGGDTIAYTLRREFKADIRVEKVLVGKGENGIVDKYAFGVNNINVKADNRYPIVFIAKGAIIEQPEEVADVRGQVTSDYQSLLEEQWVKELYAKYPVKINNKELGKIK